MDLSLFFVVIYFLLRLVLRRDSLAGLVVLVIYLAPLAVRSEFLPNLAANALVAMIGLTILTRFGVLPLVFMVPMANPGGQLLIVPDLSAWYGQETIYYLMLIAGVTAWSFHSALGGRRLLREDFLEA